MFESETVGNLGLHVISEKIETINHVFSYISSGGYFDDDVFVNCIIGYDMDKKCIGFIRYGDNKKIFPLMSFGTEYREQITSNNLHTKHEWEQLGYKLLPGAIAEELYPEVTSKRKELYYGRQDVIENDMLSFSIF